MHTVRFPGQGSQSGSPWLLRHLLCLLDSKEESHLVCPFALPQNQHLPSPLGENNKTAVSPINRFSFHSTVLIVKVSSAVPDPQALCIPLPMPCPRPLLPVPSSVQGNALCSLSSAPLVQSYLKLPALARTGVCLFPLSQFRLLELSSWGQLWRMLGHSGVGR